MIMITINHFLPRMVILFSLIAETPV